MATKNIVPRADSEGGIGTTLKRWASGWFDAINGKDISSGVATTGEVNALSTTYAPITKGVTNGDSHDHSGGDGGQIAHTALSGIGTNTHAQIDTHISNTSNPHGVTAAQAGAIPATAGAATAYVGAASESAAGIVELATTGEAQAGTDTSRAVTPAALAASAKGLISTNTTIYVATTGSDTTGTGASGTPYASIAKALSSIANKLIASGVVVTIQVADGTYAVGSTIVIDHPDADKIQILGNTSAETTVAISSIDTTAKTFTVAGDYTGSIQIGDDVLISGSSTTGLNGGYRVSGVAFAGGYTTVSCAAETFASSAVNGGNIIIMPCNRCRLISSAANCFVVKKELAQLSGMSVRAASAGSNTGILAQKPVMMLSNMALCDFNFSIAVTTALVNIRRNLFKGNFAGIVASYNATVFFAGPENCVFDHNTFGVYASSQSLVTLSGTTPVLRDNATAYSPDLGTTGAQGEMIVAA